MANSSQVENANKELKSLLADLKGARHDPFLIRAVQSLVKLTGTPDDAKAIEEENGPSPEEQKKAELKAQMEALQKQLDSL